MPSKINMFLSNGIMFPPPQPRNVAVAPKVAPVNASLNASMISRIHNIRPGCGSCGKKG